MLVVSGLLLASAAVGSHGLHAVALVIGVLVIATLPGPLARHAEHRALALTGAAVTAASLAGLAVYAAADADAPVWLTLTLCAGAVAVAFSMGILGAATPRATPRSRH